MNTNSLRSSEWYLEGFVGDSPNLRHISLNTWPFRIGRRPDLSFCLNSNSVSKEHAEIQLHGSTLTIKDLDSRNGTFVNGNRIERETTLKIGDVLHFANLEFRLGNQSKGAGHATLPNAGATMQVDRSEWLQSLGHFEQLFIDGAAIPFFQPIISFADHNTTGYEVLARSNLEGLRNPKQMFDAAARLDMESELSRLFRNLGVQIGQTLPGQPNLFLNTHPAELIEKDLLQSLRDLRKGAPTQPLTLEIHEAAITDLNVMRELHSALRDLDIQLAYDDFGAGQARLVDLIEIPPHVLKFDICLIRDIHLGTEPRRQMLETLVRMAHDLGVAVLAEGVECEAEGEVCAQLGFDYAQGYYYGRPAPASELIQAQLAQTH